MSSLLQARSASQRIKIGSQTNAWPINPNQPDTLYQSLAAIKELKFQGFETGFRNVLPLAENSSAWKQHEQGLAFFGVHIFLLQYDSETRIAPMDLATKVARVGAQLGAERLIVSGAPAFSNGNVDETAVQKKAAALNELGQQVKSLGLKLAYHNHGPEFASPQPEIEMLMQKTDASLVWFLLDAGHAFRVGANLPNFISQHHKRLTGIHLRDFQNGKQVPLGEGEFPLAQVAQTLINSDWMGWVLTEEERENGSKPGIAAVKPAREALKRTFKI